MHTLYFLRSIKLAVAGFFAVGILSAAAIAVAVAGDGDGDGYSDSTETFVGTDSLSPCNTSAAANDEPDAWPPDFNDDQMVDTLDVQALQPRFGSASGLPLYTPRYDLTTDNQISLIDAVSLRRSYGQTCQPDGPPPAPGTRIQWQGSDWYLHGVNVPWYNWGCDFGCGTSGGVRDPSVNSQLRGAFSGLQSRDIHVARWWTFPGDPWQINDDASGRPVSLNPAIYADFDEALALAEQYDLYYVFTLFSSPTSIPAAWLEDATSRAALADVLGELFAHYGDNPRVLTWQIVNEPEWSIWNNEVSKADVVSLVAEVTDSIHSNSNAYASVGSAHLDGLAMWTDLNLDYYTVHWYDYMSSGGWCARCTTYEAVVNRFNLNAPLVVGEFFAGPSTDAAQRFEDWYDKGFAGAFAWSLFSNRTFDGMKIDLEAAEGFAGGHADTGPSAPGEG